MFKFSVEGLKEAQKLLKEKEVFKVDENSYMDYAAFVLESLVIVDGAEIQKI
jgi:hypothetical protein